MDQIQWLVPVKVGLRQGCAVYLDFSQFMALRRKWPKSAVESVAICG